MEKTLSEFSMKNSSKGRLQPHCKSCQKTLYKSDYVGKKEAYKLRKYENVKRLKKEVNDLKSKTGCQCCSERELCCLDFHHIEPALKIDVISYFVNAGSRKKLFLEISKCIIVCANCHRKIHAGKIDISKLIQDMKK